MFKRKLIAVELLMVIAGAWAIVVAILRQGNNIQYLPNDLRSQPWFEPMMTTTLVVIGLFLMGFGAIRMLRARRHRNH